MLEVESEPRPLTLEEREPVMVKSERVLREVIEGKLLTALNDAAKVAMLLEVEDLDILIRCLEAESWTIAEHWEEYWPEEDTKRVNEMLTDIKQLRTEAFGNGRR